MNMAEKILARASGKREVHPGDVVVARVDTIILHDLSCYLTARVFEKEVKHPKIARPESVVVVFDHFFSPASEEGAGILQENRAFVKRHNLPHLFDSGSGNCHWVTVEQGLSRPGTVIIGSDSHTPVHGFLGAFATGVGNNSIAGMALPLGKVWFRVPETIRLNLHGRLAPGVTPRDVITYLVSYVGEGGAIYKAVEFAGGFIRDLEMEDRLLFPLMIIDMGAKAGYVEPDEKTLDYVRERTRLPFEPVGNDPDAAYERTVDIDVSSLEPQVACPPTVGNVKPVGEAAGRPVTHVEIGASPGGRLQDLRTLARILKGKKVHPDVRLQVVPLTRRIFLQALDEGLIRTIYEAGANIFPAGSGSNQAANMGALTAEQTMICTLPRNFPGRNGSRGAKVYLASAATAAASALTGKITDPREFL